MAQNLANVIVLTKHVNVAVMPLAQPAKQPNSTPKTQRETEMTMTTPEQPRLHVVRKRPPIPGGVTCPVCKHERFPYMKTCPKCEDATMRDFDTSTKELVGVKGERQ